MIGIPAEQPKKKRKIKLTFDEEEEVINPEDVDPSVGRFRNMVESTVIPKKRPHSAGPGMFPTDIRAFHNGSMTDRIHRLSSCLSINLICTQYMRRVIAILISILSW